jgi:hypothetical protein
MAQAVPQVCQLSHAGFRMLGEPMFRLSQGTRVASMVVLLQGQETVLPLRAVAREFAIDPASPDGQMLNLIEQALDFVVSLRPGDDLPSELRGGESSWDPTAADCEVATSRVWLELVRCVFARLGQKVEIIGADKPGWKDLARNAELTGRAIDGAVSQLGGPDAAEVNARVAAVSAELARVETMRRTLLRGMASPLTKMQQIPVAKLLADQRSMISHVLALAKRGLLEITNRFTEVDSRFDDMLAVLRDAPAEIAWLRHQRDWLFRTRQAWDPVFADWASASGHADEFLWKTMDRTYSFLAPRFMSFEEWTVLDAKPAKKPTMRGTVW